MSEPASATSKRRLCVDLICEGPRLMVNDSTGCCALAMVPVCDDPNRGSLKHVCMNVNVLCFNE